MSPKQDNQSSSKPQQAAPVTPQAPLPLPAAQSPAERFEARKAENLLAMAGFWEALSEEEQSAMQLKQRAEAMKMIGPDAVAQCEPIAHLFPLASPSAMNAAYLALLHYRYSEIGKPIVAAVKSGKADSKASSALAKLSAWKKRTA